ncbi:uncharacterized protein LOC114330949 [Diabrotica virgifera virgifera]|uniref:Uncharacterized protein LOC114330949 n=1 Tax=Diabrotica virgifera virgifera TaxID=50390 RepID=A0A6P7FJQ0_DIAVI|nr:uncharacterized protein LOC114330949 [Diabrotica virgifera virgifera]
MSSDDNNKVKGHISKCKIIQKTKEEILKTNPKNSKEQFLAKHEECLSNTINKQIEVCNQLSKSPDQNKTIQENKKICPVVTSGKKFSVRQPQLPDVITSDHLLGFIEFPNLGPKHAKIFASFLPSIGLFTLAATLCTVYVCEWKDVLQFLPYYSGKYKTDEE